MAMDGTGGSGIETAGRNAYSQGGDAWATADNRQEMAGLLAVRCLRQLDENSSRITGEIAMNGIRINQRSDHPGIENPGARLYRHIRQAQSCCRWKMKTKTRCLAITFRTPPTDSTGLPHIWSIRSLGGSGNSRYEPFVELMKGSMASLRQCDDVCGYDDLPCGEPECEGFLQLIDVYMDGVLQPLIPEHTFQQEGLAL